MRRKRVVRVLILMVQLIKVEKPDRNDPCPCESGSGEFKNCLNCGKEFKAVSKMHLWQKYCSRKCSRDFHNERLQKEGYFAKQAKKYRESPKGQSGIRRTWLKMKYKITPEDYDKLMAEQGGTCAICNSGVDKGYGYLCVDHNHETGEVRGLLCHRCNMHVGVLEQVDSVERCQEYIRRWNDTTNQAKTA